MALARRFMSSERLLEALNDPQLAPHPDAFEYYNIDIHRHQEHQIRATFIDLKITFKTLTLAYQNPEFVGTFLLELFENILTVFQSAAPENSFLRMVLLPVRDESLRPISIPFIALETFSAHIILDKVMKVLNSGEFYDLTNLQIHAVIQKGDKKGGTYNNNIVNGYFYSRKIRSMTDYLDSRKCLVSIKNRDNLCAGRALIIGKKLLAKEKIRRISNLLVWRLYKNAGVLLGRAGFLEFQNFQKSADFRNIQINVFTLNTNAQNLNIFFSGPNANNKINLLLEDGHFWVFRNVAYFLCKRQFCFVCYTSYNNIHKCSKAKCQICKNIKCENSLTNITSQCLYCYKCRLVFTTPQCMIAHEGKECEKYMKCEACGIKILRKARDKHKDVCGLILL